MSRLLWGKVFYKDTFAGILREEPGGGASFHYDESYIMAKNPPISHVMPLTSVTHISYHGLHPFFDNLVAEGWLEHAQSRLLKTREPSRFQLLLAFGFDCAGAVSIIDPEPETLSKDLLDIADPKEMAILTSRASLSGVQPKIAVIERQGKYYASRMNELSTHLAKFPSNNHPDLIENEYLTMKAFQALLPEDDVVHLTIDIIEGLKEPALIIKRFDRTSEGRVHFEEFNQLLQKKSNAKYNGSYEEMSIFMRNTTGCLPVENARLYKRILAGLLLGNTDMHFKNFAMLHDDAGLRLAPSYDQVSATLYQYQTIALALDGKTGGARNRSLNTLKSKNVLGLGEGFSLSNDLIAQIIRDFEKNKAAAKEAIFSSPMGKEILKNALIKGMETRWNGIFNSIGKKL
jgi:serine/threonine-protein kinase HipA